MKTEQTISDRVARLTPRQKRALRGAMQNRGLVTNTSDRQQLTAWIVPNTRNDLTLDAEAIRKQALEKLPAAMVPKQFRFVHSLPRTSNGKLDRSRLPTIASTNAFKRPNEPNISSDALVLCNICAELLGLEHVTPSESFFDLGGDSFLSIRLVALARQSGLQIEPKDVMESGSLAELAARGRSQTDAQDAIEQSNSESTHAVVEIRSGTGAGSVLFAHEIGGECHYSQYIAEYLSADLTLLVSKQHLASDYTGNATSLEALAADYTDQWLRRDPDGPHHLVSYCWGGLLAYEIGEQFRKRGSELTTLSAIEFGTESAYRFAPKWNRFVDRNKGLWHRIKNRLAMIGREESLSRFIKSISRKILRKRRPQPLEASDFNFAKDMGNPKLIEANFAQYFDYDIQPSNQMIHLFRSPERTLIGTRYIDSTYGWRYLVGNNVHVSVIDGGHSGCIRPPHAEALGKAINQVINAATAK